MSQLWPKRLRTKFYAGMLIILVAMGSFFAATIYFHLRNLLDAQVQDKADLIFNQVESVQGYVRKVLRPTMYKVLGDSFIIEAMSSSFISRQIMEGLDLPEYQYLYRRVAINARNPKFEANELELELVDWFRAHPGAEHWSGTRDLGGSKYYLQARPVVFGGGCMHCHGEPAEAPPELIERYGDEKGFYTPMDEVRGVDLVGLLVQDSVLAIKDATSMFVVLFAAGTLLFFTTVTLFFNRLVMHNLRRLTDVMHRHFEGDVDSEVLERLSQGDEIGEMIRAMEELAGHLHTVRRQLVEHSANLERVVDERTLELKNEASERQTDVQLFVGMLGALNRSQSRQELVPRALEKITQRFGAERSAYVCLFTDDLYTWPDPRGREDMPEDWKALVASGEGRFESDRALIPVLATNASRGLLVLVWPQGRAFTPQEQQMLLALGQQMGIALENLDALDNLLRQMDILKSIFSGISDPLVLTDDSCRVLLANQAALDLAGSLDEAAEDRGEVDLLSIFGLPGPDSAACPLREAMQSGQPTVRDAVLSDGRSFSLSLYPQLAYGSETPRLVVYARETTSEKRMQVKLQQTERIIAVGKLAAGLAHEINNPLGVIITYAQLLAKSIDDEQMLEDLDVIVRHTKKAQSVLENLLNFARRPQALTGGPCSLGAVIDSVFKVFSVQAEAKGVALKKSLPPELPMVQADGSAMDQILTNLILNALDAVAPDTGVIAISALHVVDRDEVIVTVADNGPGILDENLSLVFDPFFTTKEVGKGSGLGLAVAYGLLQDMGGRITVGNKGGAVFTLHLPTAVAKARI